MKFALKNVLPNPFRSFERSPIEQERVDALKESISVGGFHDHLPGRVVGKKIQIVYGHHRVEAMRQLFDGDKEVEFDVVSYSDSQMIQQMVRENHSAFSHNIQTDLENVRVAIGALAAGKITEAEFPPPAKASHTLRYAPSFRLGFPEGGKPNEHPYDATTLGKYLGYTKADGHPTERLRYALDALDLNEAGELPDHILNRFESLASLESVVEERMEERELDRIQEQKEKKREYYENAEQEQTKKLEAEIRGVEKEVKDARKAEEIKSKAVTKAYHAWEKGDAKAKKTEKPADIKRAQKLGEATDKLQKTYDEAKSFAESREQVLGILRDKLRAIETEQRKENEAAEERERVRAEQDKERERVEEEQLAQEEAGRKRIHTFKKKIIDIGYKSLALKYHPDAAGGEHEAMVDLNLAKEELDEEVGDYSLSDAVN